MTETYDCKVERIVTGRKDAKQMRVLGRVITIEEDGVAYEADQRHVETVCKYLQIQTGNPCATTWEKDASSKGDAKRNRALRTGMATIDTQVEDNQGCSAR